MDGVSPLTSHPIVFSNHGSTLFPFDIYEYPKHTLADCAMRCEAHRANIQDGLDIRLC
jgi:hypothetical protein